MPLPDTTTEQDEPDPIVRALLKTFAAFRAARLAGYPRVIDAADHHEPSTDAPPDRLG